MTKKLLIVAAEGFEDVELVAPLDVLTRLGIEVTLAGLDDPEMRGAWGARLIGHTTLQQAAARSAEFDGLLFPGGKKNAQALAENATVRNLIREFMKSGKLVAAICASPSHILGESADVVRGRAVCGDPAFNDRLEKCGGRLSGLPVTVDRNLITATGPGSALLFGLHVGAYLAGFEAAKQFADKWGVPFSP